MTQPVLVLRKLTLGHLNPGDYFLTRRGIFCQLAAQKKSTRLLTCRRIHDESVVYLRVTSVITHLDI